MIIIKLISLQILAILGLLVGSLITPEPPLYPFFPSDYESELIKYTEIHINLMMGFIVATISVFSSKFLKLPYLYAFIAAIIAGVLFGLIDSFRVGEIPPLNFLLVTSYFFGLVLVCGFIKIIEEIIKMGQPSLER